MSEGWKPGEPMWYDGYVIDDKTELDKKVYGKPVEWPWFGEEGVKSDGGSTDYYLLPEHATELKHLISHKGMSFARGNIFKACYRLGEKEGTDVLYDLNKIKFFVEDLIEMYERGEDL